MAKTRTEPDTVPAAPAPLIDEGNGEPRQRWPYGQKPRCRVTRYGVTTFNDGHKNTRVYKRADLVWYCVCDDCGANWKESRDKNGGPELTPNTGNNSAQTGNK